jgi:hypothetical protein
MEIENSELFKQKEEKEGKEDDFKKPSRVW